MWRYHIPNFIAVIIINLLHKINGSAVSTGILVVEVLYGENIILKCNSNDQQHLFDYWVIENTGLVIGPSNENYNLGKYKYDVLSGNLTVKAATFGEEGIYQCVSKGIRSNDIKIAKTKLSVTQTWEELYEHDPNINLIRILIALITIVLLAIGCYVVYKVWKNRYRYPHYLNQDDDDDSAEEIFSAPGTSGMSRLKSPLKIVKDKYSEKQKSPDSDNNFETISTDFTSILHVANE